MASHALTDEQKATVAQWVAAGADLNQIQDRLRSELGVTMTFMATRFLISDLGLSLKEAPPPEDIEETILPEKTDRGRSAETAPGGFTDDSLGEPMSDSLEETASRTGGGGGSVKVVLDEIAIPGALASGKVSFSDGRTATWYLDQMGRLGLGGVDRGYQPPESDVVAFQRELQGVLRRAGY